VNASTTVSIGSSPKSMPSESASRTASVRVPSDE
jgi:hypothetical protein